MKLGLLDIANILGVFMLLVTVLSVMAVVAFLIAGLRAKHKKRDTDRFSWWLSSLAAWVFVAGVLRLSACVTGAYFVVGNAEDLPEVLLTRIGEGSLAVFVASLVALIALTGRMLVVARRVTSSTP